MGSAFQLKQKKMKHLIVTAIALLTSNFSFAQDAFNLAGKTFEYFNNETNSKEQYAFISNTEAKLIMLSEFSGQSYKDVCSCKSSVDGNIVKISCNCEDKEIYPEPLKESFIYDKNKNTLTTTIHYDRHKNPRIFKLML